MNKITNEAKQLLNRGLDAHLRIGVTGLSRAGKTAFITSFVDQLLHTSTHDNLPLLAAQRDARVLGARRVPQKNLLTPRFNLDGSYESLTLETPQWPTPTRDVSEIRIAIKYKPSSKARKLISRHATLYVDLVDYPGEWLLDLPMLEMDFQAWSEQQLLRLQQINLPEVEAWLARSQHLDYDEFNDDKLINDVAAQYTKLLLDLKSKGYQLIQPGRFVLPGELADAPVVLFFPYIFKDKPAKGSAVNLLSKRYKEYQQQVIKPFYRHYFSSFDRQILLVDVLTPLNQGEHAFSDMQVALTEIMKSFSYGKNSLIRRLCSPRTDKLLFAATKADHITPDQHSNLNLLLRHLVQPIWQHVSFESVSMECMPFASIKSTDAGFVDQKGKSIPVVNGTTIEGNALTLYPGEVPATLPKAEFWDKQGFDFVSFRPQNYVEATPLPHIGMDKVMQFLLGDKLR
ncbi:nucleoside triphosphate hydrolase [Vibrio breoganii]|uniref:YcjX family protein n=1 Tax=Vibrio breoganii TaxID=553239 RepID=UPI000C83A731|nr:YcjX family protein [Vibrio breoganii]PMF98680.1 nucleoside triphosphate hydrolase [Vibrio breoganii]